MSDGGMRSLKRSLSPEHSSFYERKSKLAKIEFEQQENENTNKENIEMVMVKHLLSTTEDEDEVELSSDSSLPWFHSNSLWTNMITKTYDQTYKSRPNFLDAHPALNTKMRSVLCDWLIEVCEVYNLHRETYHLAIAYIDQYLSNTSNLPKSKLQLLGITSLFIAAKIEEIYPPRIAEFAYVTDKAYYEGDILEMELDIMNSLNWYINPMTSISWLSLYLQLECEFEYLNKSSSPTANVTPSHDDRCIKKRRLSLSNLSKISSNSDLLKTSVLTNVHRTSMFNQTFNLVVRLIDFCSLDIEYSQFPKNVLVATAIFLCKPNWPVEQITSLNDEDLYICTEWMKPFYDVLYYGQNLHSIPNPASRPAASVPIDEIYSIQIHNISLDLLENVYKKRPKFIPSTLVNRPLSNLVNRFSWLPTPPTSLEKQQHELNLPEQQIQITEVISIVR